MRIGIDLGGTKIEALVMADDGTELVRRRVATPQGNYHGTLIAIKNLVASVLQGHNCDGVPVGITIPGAISPATGLVKNANSTCLIGKPFDFDLATALERPVRLANDANCFVLS